MDPGVNPTGRTAVRVRLRMLADVDQSDRVAGDEGVCAKMECASPAASPTVMSFPAVIVTAPRSNAVIEPPAVIEVSK